MSANLVTLLAILCAGTVVLADKPAEFPAGDATVKPKLVDDPASAPTVKPADPGITTTLASSTPPVTGPVGTLVVTFVRNVSFPVVPGKAYRFDCETDLKMDPVWLINNRTANLDDPRFKKYPNNSLEIRNATKSDEGEWSCGTITLVNATLAIVPQMLRSYPQQDPRGSGFVIRMSSSLMLCGLLLRFRV